MASAKAYRVRGWDDSGFEVAQNSRTRGPLKWVALPTKHDGKGFRRVMRHKDGVAFFGCWCLLVQVAAKCPTRGLLADEDGPLSAHDLHLKTDVPVDVMERAMVFLCNEVGWLERVDVDAHCPLDPPRPPTHQPCAKETGPAVSPGRPLEVQGAKPVKPPKEFPDTGIGVDNLQQTATACNGVLPTRRDVQDVRNETERTTPPTPPDPELPDRADDIPLPDNLSGSKLFIASWATWLNYRRDRRLSMRTMTIERQLAMLSRLGPELACDALETSIRCGWSGVFPPKGDPNARASKRRNGAGQTFDPSTTKKRPTIGGF